MFSAHCRPALRGTLTDMKFFAPDQVPGTALLRGCCFHRSAPLVLRGCPAFSRLFATELRQDLLADLD